MKYPLLLVLALSLVFPVMAEELTDEEWERRAKASIARAEVAFPEFADKGSELYRRVIEIDEGWGESGDERFDHPEKAELAVVIAVEAMKKEAVSEDWRRDLAKMKADSEKMLEEQKARERDASDHQAKVSRDFEAMQAESLAARLAVEEELRANQKRIDRAERRRAVAAPRYSPMKADELGDSAATFGRGPAPQKGPSGTMVTPSGVKNYWTNKDGSVQISGPDGITTIYPD